MVWRNFRKLFLFFVFGILIGESSGLSNDELIKIARTAIEKERSAGLTKLRIQALTESFQGLSDSEKTKAIALLLLSYENDERLRMKGFNASGMVSSLIVAPDLIKDPKPLQEMVKNEEDPRRFFLLSKLSDAFVTTKKSDFIPEKFRMLFREGHVSKEEGEYTLEYWNDVSLYAYKSIIGSLKIYESSFVPPSNDLPHKERVLILANWLIANWPGCENLTIPDKRRPRKYSNNKADNNLTATAQLGKVTKTDGEATDQRPSHWIVIAAIAFLISSLAVWWKARLSKT